VKEALIIGIAQAMAIIPGVSRSGITMTAGLLLGLERTAAARFSFLLATPIITGAGLYELTKLVKEGFSGIGLEYLWGFISAAASGYLAVAFLMRYLVSNTFYPFVWYRIALAAVVAAILIY
jgi:undecaprenyl-diphosphatase